jgi:hypothetical protein
MWAKLNETPSMSFSWTLNMEFFKGVDKQVCLCPYEWKGFGFNLL